MIDHLATLLALRARALTLAVCTTGSASLAATKTGYTRAAGSFITDGFKVGMEAAPSGFTSTTPSVITKVEALTLTTNGTRDAEAAASGRTLAVGLPAIRAWENERRAKVPGRCFLEESYSVGPSNLRGQVENGILEETGLYTLRVYSLENLGAEGLFDYVDALLALFRPGAALPVLPNGDRLYIRSDAAARRGELLPGGAGWVYVPVTLPWRVFTTNS